MNDIHEDLWMDILIRLPIKSILRCKCVCKSWRDLIEDSRFGKSYTPKPCMAMAFDHRDKMGYAVVDEACQPLFRFGLPPPYDQYPTRAVHRVVLDSVNGLLLLWDGPDANDNILFVVNPITCEYIELPHLATRRCLFGFGVSKLSGQYKILCVDETRFCHVYTLGGVCWRSIPAAETSQLLDLGDLRSFVPPKELEGTITRFDYAIFFNGYIHWLARDFKNNFMVSCFDLETDLFTCFSLPSLQDGKRAIKFSWSYRLCILDGRLCLCDLGHSTKIVIWKMNNYGDKNSWTVEYNFNRTLTMAYTEMSLYLRPIKVLANGDLLFSCGSNLFIYSKNTEDIAAHVVLKHCAYYMLPSIIIYTPNFVSLNAMRIVSLKMEDGESQYSTLSISGRLLVRSYFCNN